MKKVWITGARGRVGTALCKLLDSRDYELLITDSKEVDITKRDEVYKQMQAVRPDVVINCAAMTDVEACEKNPDLAYRVNALGPRNLAVEADAQQCKLIQISTDDVFSMRSEVPYNEFDHPHPMNVYGKSKYAGEQMAQKLCTRFVIVRSSWVYGTTQDFVTGVLNAVKEGQPALEVPVNQRSSPTSARELAKVITQFIDKDIYGIYHAACTGSCSRFEFAGEILRRIGKENELELIPIAKKDGVRTTYSVLDNMMLRLDGLEEPPHWRKALADYLEEIGGESNG